MSRSLVFDPQKLARAALSTMAGSHDGVIARVIWEQGNYPAHKKREFIKALTDAVAAERARLAKRHKR